MEWWQDIFVSDIRWYRSWPATSPEGRAFVQDSLPRLIMSDCDYSTVQEWPDDDPGFCMLEWDVALDLESRNRFVELAEQRPDRILVAPYIKSYGGAIRQIHSHMGYNPIAVGDTRAENFGLGCVYLPQAELQRFLVERDPREPFTDTSLSTWYWTKRHRFADVTWEVRPQHLHGD